MRKGEPQKFRRKVVEVEAVQVMAGGISADFLRDDENMHRLGDGSVIVRRNGKGRIAECAPGDWLIREPDGMLVTCWQRYFAEAYELADDERGGDGNAGDPGSDRTALGEPHSADVLVDDASTQPVSESPGDSGERVVFPTHRIAALFGRDDRDDTRRNLIGRVERDVEDLADKGEHLAAATERMGLELVLRSTNSDPGRRDR